MSEAGNILQETVARLLSDHLDGDRWPEEGEWPADLWRALVETGLPSLMVPEDRGGAGVPPPDAFAVIRTLGRVAAPVPLADTILAAKVLGEAGLTVPDGPLAMASEADELALDGPEGDGTITGSARAVPWGREIEALVAMVPADGGAMLCCVPVDADMAEPGANLAGEPRDDLILPKGGVKGVAAVPLNDPGLLLRQGAILRAVQMAGALEAVLEMAVGYAQERVQFGRPIAKFQAIQQQLAELAGEVAVAQTAARAAFLVMDHPDAGFEVAAAKVRVNEAATRGAAIAHQVHGAIGFTQEYALHRLTRRLWSWRQDFGNEATWSEDLGRRVAQAGSDALWPRLVVEPTDRS